MPSSNVKMVLFAAWTVAVVLLTLGTGTRSATNWIVAVFVSVVPPLVIRYFWRFPDRTISERIYDARR